MADGCGMPLGFSSNARKTRRRGFPKTGLSGDISRPVFWNLLQALAMGAETSRQASLSFGEWIINEEFFDAKQEALQMHEPVLNTTGQYVG